MAGRHLYYDGDLKLNRCSCGGRAEVWRDPMKGIWYVRCRDCRRRTEPHINEEVAIEEWNEDICKRESTSM